MKLTILLLIFTLSLSAQSTKTVQVKPEIQMLLEIKEELKQIKKELNELKQKKAFPYYEAQPWYIKPDIDPGFSLPIPNLPFHLDTNKIRKHLLVPYDGNPPIRFIPCDK